MPTTKENQPGKQTGEVQYQCAECKKVVNLPQDKPAPTCCGKPMQKIGH